MRNTHIISVGKPEDYAEELDIDGTISQTILGE
jgi:hypothetical protein